MHCFYQYSWMIDDTDATSLAKQTDLISVLEFKPTSDAVVTCTVSNTVGFELKKAMIDVTGEIS